MKLDKEQTIPVNGYIIKNLVCQTSTFKVCDAIDTKGNSFVLKIIPADIKVNLLKEEHVVESFVHNDKLFIVYAENNFAKEGPDYFSYYMDQSTKILSSSSSSASVRNEKDQIPSILTNKNYNNMTSAGTGIVSPLLDNENNENNNNNNNNNTTHLCFDDISMISHLKKKKMFGNITNNCSKRLRTPIPKDCNFILPSTPESNISISEEEEEEESGSESDSECDSIDSFDDDDDDNDDDDNDEDSEIVTLINNKLEQSISNGLIPILKAHHDNNNISNMIPTNNFSNNNTSPIHKTEPNYVSQPSHIHIQCPLTRIIHSKHTTIRKTPIPREMLHNNNNNNDTSFQFTQDKIRTDTSCGGPFKLEMVKSSMLRRRSSTKCQFST